VIPNIVKGRGVSGALAYCMGEGYEAAPWLTKQEYAEARAAGLQLKGPKVQLAEGEASRATILGGQNFGFEVDSAERLDLARRVMEWVALPENQASRGRKCEKDCFHATLAWAPEQEPTDDEMRDAGQSFLKALGMEKAHSVFIRHDDKGHPHLHIVASRIDPETGRTLSEENDFTNGQAWALKYERQHGIPQSQERRRLHKMVDAIEARDITTVTDLLTERSPTFTAWELDKSLILADMTPDDRAKFRNHVLHDAEVVGLRETQDAKITRYTTRKVLHDELAVLRGVDQLAGQSGFGVERRTVTDAAEKFTLIPEQNEAVAHLTDKKRFGMLWGEAGTGKSHTLKAVRWAYEQEGFEVVGLAHTNKVVQQMRGDGFRANTIMKELQNGAAHWNRKTVVVVDEAAMVSTELLGQIVAAAVRAGAKLILAGDDAQLGSIERGGLFETLRLHHGCAVLEQVMRVSDAAQQAAFNEMHKGKFRTALDTFAKLGGIVWTEKQDDALREMAKAFTADHAADPTKKRFMIAGTNAEVDALNSYAHAMRQQRGELGEEHTIKTAYGDLAVAVGDRLQFTSNGTRMQKSFGLVTAGFATVTALEAPEGKPARMSIAIDAAGGGTPREMTLTVGDDWRKGEFNSFKLGYSGTIWKSQGDSISQVYCCHSSNLRNANSYVGFTRHKISVTMFVARDTIRRMDKLRTIFAHGKAVTPEDTVRALDIMAAGMEREQNKRAATAYYIDRMKLSVDFRSSAADATKAEPVQAYFSKFMQTERQQEERRKTLQALSLLLGGDVPPRKAPEIQFQRGQSR
jgi:AAA domain/Relaxase/Mobilisation nuclease domain